MEVAFGDCWVECVVVFVDFDGAVVGRREKWNDCWVKLMYNNKRIDYTDNHQDERDTITMYIMTIIVIDYVLLSYSISASTTPAINFRREVLLLLVLLGDFPSIQSDTSSTNVSNTSSFPNDAF